jgi:hypothetical protein
MFGEQREVVLNRCHKLRFQEQWQRNDDEQRHLRPAQAGPVVGKDVADRPVIDVVEGIDNDQYSLFYLSLNGSDEVVDELDEIGQ